MNDVSKKILVVDDDPGIIKLLKTKFEEQGCRVITAKDGLVALELAKAEKPDLIVLDINMPVLNGFHVCRKLKFEEKDFSDTPIIILTERDELIDKEIGQEVGADLYITKPFDTDAFLAQVIQYLQ